jgi:hypothetical protein
MGHATERMSWTAIRERKDLQGRWVALDECVYDDETGEAAEGSVVDADESLLNLCERLREEERRNCQILFCSAPA